MFKLRTKRVAAFIAKGDREKNEDETSNALTDLELFDYEKICDDAFASTVLRPFFDRVVPALYWRFYLIENGLCLFRVSKFCKTNFESNLHIIC